MSKHNTPANKQNFRKEYFIDLKKIYENQPNQDWTPDIKNDNGTMSLHQNLAERLTRSIWKAVRENDQSSKHDWVSGWSNLNYFISGERCSGKSTFLRYISRCIIGKESPFPSLEERVKEEAPPIEMLFFCDPTAMTSNEHFFIAIVAALNDWLKKQTQENTTNKNHYPPLRAYAPQKEKHFTDHIKTLAQGIRQLNNGRSSAKAELDAASQLSLGMTNSSRALTLKTQFDNLINDIAESYGVKAFLISIDDADIEFTKNKLIIEIIRTYLTHPRLIILFTGDTLLTHEAIREKQFSQFGLDFHKVDIVNQKRRWELTDAMTAQYIKKIFPPSNHLHLTSLHDTIKENKDYSFTIGYDSGEEQKEELEPFLHRLFINTLDNDTKRVKLLIEGFLRLPLRSIMHTLRYWGDRQIFSELGRLENLQREIDNLKHNTGEQQPKATSTKEESGHSTEHETKLQQAEEEGQMLKDAISHMLAKSFRSAFNDELLSMGFNKADLEMATPYQLAHGLLLHCFNSKDISYGHRLVISACRHDNQESTFFLAAKEAVIAQNFGDALSFALFGVFTVHAYRYYQQTSLVKDVQPNIGSYDLTKVQQYLRHKQQGFIDYLFSSKNEDPLRWTRKISLIFLVHNGQKPTGNDTPAPLPIFLSRGVYYLSNRTDIELVNHILSNQFNSIIGASDNGHDDAEDSFRLFLLLLISCGQASNHQNVYYLSAYNIFGFILNCYNICNEKAPDGEDAKTWTNNRLNEFIQGFYAPFAKANDIPTWGGAFPVPKECADIHPPVFDTALLAKSTSHLSSEIYDWFTQDTKLSHLCAFDIGQAADSIYRTLCNLCNSILSDTRNSLSEDDPSPLLEAIRQLVIHIPSSVDSTEKATKPALVACISKFPLCLNLKVLCDKLKTAAEEAEEQAVAISSLPFLIRNLSNSISTTKEEIANIEKMIKDYFPDFRSIKRMVASPSPFLFCKDSKHTLRESQTICQYFSRMKEHFSTIREALHLCSKRKRNIKRSSPGIYLHFYGHLKKEVQKCLAVRAEMRRFRNEIRQAFMKELAVEISDIRKKHNKDLREQQRELDTLLRDLKLTSIHKIDNRGGSVKPDAMSNAAQTAVKFYRIWKQHQHQSNASTHETEGEISELSDVKNLKPLCDKLHISESTYINIFSPHTEGIVNNQQEKHKEIKSIFEQYAKNVKANLHQLSRETKQAADSYLAMVPHLNESNREQRRDRMLTLINKMEDSLYSLQNIMTRNMNTEFSLNGIPNNNMFVDFCGEYNLRPAFHEVYATLFTIQREIETFRPIREDDN